VATHVRMRCPGGLLITDRSFAALSDVPVAWVHQAAESFESVPSIAVELLSVLVPYLCVAVPLAVCTRARVFLAVVGERYKLRQIGKAVRLTRACGGAGLHQDGADGLGCTGAQHLGPARRHLGAYTIGGARPADFNSVQSGWECHSHITHSRAQAIRRRSSGVIRVLTLLWRRACAAIDDEIIPYKHSSFHAAFAGIYFRRPSSGPVCLMSDAAALAYESGHHVASPQASTQNLRKPQNRGWLRVIKAARCCYLYRSGLHRHHHLRPTTSGECGTLCLPPNRIGSGAERKQN
jgi:hypothetical protein